MKPVSVRFKCFGPYVQEQFVDFTQLEQNGLFLICGETGSGKTTILDAMCYALYGESSGGTRGDMTAMRCKQASPDEETFVEFIFDSGGNRYRFYRYLKPPKARKTTKQKARTTLSDFNTVYECEMLVDGVFVPLADTKDKKEFLDKKAVELIGLNYHQFRQVIILPQGQFESLLVAKSDEKEEILVTLFHAERWQRLAERMYRLAEEKQKAVMAEGALIAAKLREYGCTDPAELTVKAQEAGDALTGLQQTLDGLLKQVGRSRKQYDEMLLANRDFEQRDQLKKELDALLPKTEPMRREEVLLEQADRAETITAVYRDYEAAIGEVSRAAKKLTQTRGALQTAERTFSQAQEAWKRHEQGREQYRRDQQMILRLENARDIYVTLKAKKDAADAAARVLSAAQKEADTTDKELRRACQSWEAAVLAQQQAIQDHQQAQRRYLNAIGSILAQQLQAGQACPVCGSREHPAPAKTTVDQVTDAQLDAFAKAVEEANARESILRRQRSAAEEANARAQLTLAERKQADAVARAEYAQALDQRIAGIETEQALDRELRRLKLNVRAYEDGEAKLRDALNSADSGVQTARSGVSGAEDSLRGAEEACGQRKAAWEQVRSAAGFDCDSQYSAACMDAGAKTRRRTALIRFNTDLQKAREAYERKCAELADRPQPDVAGAKQRLDAAERDRDEVRGQILLKEREQKRMAKDAGELEKRHEAFSRKRGEVEAEMEFARRLRGDNGIGLQRYVLGVMLTSITMAANQLLKTVYGGRYQLFRTNESSGRKHKRGLELEIYDANSNERRSVTTLSGGEKFLVALSLAIGLSAVVQAKGSGVRLEAMFIDEGFGSLDRESVNDALEVLHGIRRSAGLVGIISHVEQLAETIPSKIRITKTKNGSQCQVCG